MRYFLLSSLLFFSSFASAQTASQPIPKQDLAFLKDAQFEKNVQFTSFFGKKRLPAFFTLIPGEKGKVGIIWAETRSQFELPESVYTATLDKGHLSPPQKLNGQGKGIINSIVTFPLGNKTLVLFSQEPVKGKTPPQAPWGTGQKTHYVEKLYSIFWDGNQFSSATLIPNQGAGAVYDLVLKEGKNGTLAALWSQQVEERWNSPYMMFGATWNGKKWTTQRLSHAWYQPNGRGKGDKPVVIKRKDGTLVALWSHDSGNKEQVASIQLYTSDWDGTTWSKPTTLLKKGIFWRFDNEQAEGGAPSSAGILESELHKSHLTAFETSEGEIVAAWEQPDSKNPQSFEYQAQIPMKPYFSVKTKGQWSPPQELTYSNANVFDSKVKLIQLDNGNVLAIWPFCQLSNQKNLSSLCALSWNGNSFVPVIPAGSLDGPPAEFVPSSFLVDELQFLPQADGSLLAVWIARGKNESQGWANPYQERKIFTAQWKENKWTPPKILFQSKTENPHDLEWVRGPADNSFVIFSTFYKTSSTDLHTSLYAYPFEGGIPKNLIPLSDPKLHTDIAISSEEQSKNTTYSFPYHDGLLVVWKQKSQTDQKVTFLSAILDKGKLQVTPIWQTLDYPRDRSVQLEQPLCNQDGSRIILLGQNIDTLYGKQWDGGSWKSILTWKNPKEPAGHFQDFWLFGSPISGKDGSLLIGIQANTVLDKEKEAFAGILTFHAETK